MGGHGLGPALRAAVLMAMTAGLIVQIVYAGTGNIAAALLAATVALAGLAVALDGRWGGESLAIGGGDVPWNGRKTGVRRRISLAGAVAKDVRVQGMQVAQRSARAVAELLAQRT